MKSLSVSLHSLSNDLCLSCSATGVKMRHFPLIAVGIGLVLWLLWDSTVIAVGIVLWCFRYSTLVAVSIVLWLLSV